MATMTSSSSAIVGAVLVPKQKIIVSSLQIHGMPQTVWRGGGVICSLVKKPDNRAAQTSGTSIAAAAAAAAASVMSLSSPAMALVDERMSTEGTGLTLGISNSVLGWILFGVFGLIWSLYFVYTSTLDEDEDSGLSL